MKKWQKPDRQEGLSFRSALKKPFLTVRLLPSEQSQRGNYEYISGHLGTEVFGIFQDVNKGDGALRFEMMREYVEKAMTFAEYIKLIDDLLLDGKTTGPTQSEAMFGYGKLNRQRMHRLEKTVVLTDSIKIAANDVDRKMVWLIITEGWCGDAAQNLPVIEKIARESINIETRYLLRDENPDLIDRYLTDGGRAIPKLIALDGETFDVLGTWGARPAATQELYLEMKNQSLAKALVMENLQRWYIADKNQAVQAEFEALLSQWSEKAEAAAV